MERKQEYFSSSFGFVEEDRLYITSVEHGILIEINLKTKKKHRCCDFYCNLDGRFMRTMGMMRIGVSLYFILRDTRQIFEYNFITKKSNIYGDYEIIFERRKHLAAAFNDNNIIWIFPFSIDEKIFTFNINCKTYHNFKSVKDILREERIDLNGQYYISQGILYEGCVWFVVIRTSYICCVSLKDGMSRVWNIGSKYSLGGIEVNDEGCCLVMADKHMDVVCEWKMEDNKIDEYKVINVKEYYRRRYYRTAVPYKNKIFVIPLERNTICVVDKEKQKQSCLEYPEEFRHRPEYMTRALFWGYTVKDNKIYLYPCSHNGILILYMDTYEFEFIETLMDKESMLQYSLSSLHINGQCEESELLEIEDYMNIIDIYRGEDRTKKKLTIGGLIYRNILMEI